MTLYSSGLESRVSRQFLAIVKYGSFKSAAEHLCISQAALSTSMRQLEDKLDVKLFERHPGGVKATIYGETLYLRAKIVESELSLAIDEIECIRGAKKGIVKMGAGPSILSSVIADLVVLLTEKRPDIELKIVSGPQEALFCAVVEGDVELAITTFPGGPPLEEIHFEKIYEMTTYPIVRRGHPLDGSSEIEWEEIRKYPWIIVDPDSEPSEQALFRILNSKAPRTIIKTNSPSLIKSVVRKSDCITFMPDIMIAHDENEHYSILGLTRGIYRTPMGIITRSRGNLSASVKYVREELRSLMEKEDFRR